MTMDAKEARDYAGFWVRVGSVCIDAFLISWLWVISVALVTALTHSSISTGNFLKFILFYMISASFLITIFYFAWFNANGRQSPGKKLFGIVVLDNSLRPISFSQSVGRAIVYLFDYLLLGLGHLLIVFNKKKKALHDLVAKTVVVRVKSKNKLQPLLIVSTVIVYFFVAELPASFLKANYVQAFRIPTGHLKPTILMGDFILVDKYSPTEPKPKPSDLIVFKYPLDESLDYIERCIATGGQTVEIKESKVYVNGQPEGQVSSLGKEFDPDEGRYVENLKVLSRREKEYVIRQYADINRTNFGPVKVLENNYFVLGDNRDNSADSRSWGFVPEENIVGRSAFIYFSWNRSQKKVRWSRIGKVVE